MHPTPSPLCWQSEVSDLHPGVKASIAHLIFIVSCLCGKRDNGSKPSDGGGCGGEGHGAWSRLFIETLVDRSCCNQVAVVLLDCSSANKKSCPSSNPRWPCLGFWGEIESLLSTYLSSEAIYVWFGLIWFQLGIQGDESQCKMSYLSRSQSVRKEVKKKEFLEQYASCLHVVLKNIRNIFSSRYTHKNQLLPVQQPMDDRDGQLLLWHWFWCKFLLGLFLANEVGLSPGHS